jgi:hypothetical protein
MHACYHVPHGVCTHGVHGVLMMYDVYYFLCTPMPGMDDRTARMDRKRESLKIFGKNTLRLSQNVAVFSIFFTLVIVITWV